MALNIAKQISEKPYTKNILIVGAGHAISSSSLYHFRHFILILIGWSAGSLFQKSSLIFKFIFPFLEPQREIACY